MNFIRVPYRRPTRLSSFESRIRDSTPPVSIRPRLVSDGQRVRPAKRIAFVRVADNLRHGTIAPRATVQIRESPENTWAVAAPGGEHSIRYPATDFDLMPLVTTPKDSRGLSS